ncbi:SDR family NAD(P)-dependent oxidoreductase [Streptomyces sp. 796.1]|uniref:SDR family NAD(P)-dependent oxidoreductase n=1 Tax=Streptomyces sp. 796.1 TaxID=3163029 RepID=UPI0039C970D4
MTTTQQQAIGSGFGAHSTAQQVVADVDLTGKLAVVTGGYAGLGLATTRALVGAGARVVVPARRPEVARAATEGIEGVEIDALDLADLDGVRDFADRFLATGRTIDLVFNNAGIMACPLTRVGPGWEAQFATNHLGHYALVNRLWPAIADGGARVVSVSSRGHQLSGMRWQDVHFGDDAEYDKWLAYGQAKTANVLFAVELDRRGRGSGVRAYAAHPGVILTELARHIPVAEQRAAGWIDAEGRPTDPNKKTPEQGAATQVWAATSARLADAGGVYCEDCDIAQPWAGDTPLTSGVAAHATDVEQAARLWDLSAELTGVNALAAAG